jgi:hypothetical protein
MITELYILDRNKKIVCILSNQTGEKVFYDYTYTSYLETGAEIFNFSVILNNDIEKYIKNMNYVLFKRKDKIKMFQIKEYSDDEIINSTVRTVKSEFIGLELYEDSVRESIIEGNIRKVLETILQDTSYEIGYISPKLDDVIGTIEIEKPTPIYSAIQQCIPIFKNIEIEFDFELINSINGKYRKIINIYADGERGRKTYKRFDYDFNTYGSSRDGDAIEFCSGLIPVGSNGIGIKEIEWYKANGFPLDKPLGQDFIVDPEAHDMFSNEGKYILKPYETNDSNPSELIWNAYYKLQELKKEKYTYDIPIYLTEEEYDDIEIGDTVYIVNDKFYPSIQLEARITELQLSDNRENNKAIFANYKEVRSNIKNLDRDSIINEAIKKINDIGIGKLTIADILTLKEYLTKLGIEEKEIDEIYNKLINEINPAIPQLPEIAEDSEDYTKIYINSTDGGLWIGDERIADIRKYKCATITSEEGDASTDDDPNGTIPPSSQINQEYYEAVQHYKTFNLGTKQNTTTVSNILSSNNKYKLNIIVPYWAEKFGLDKNLVVAVIIAESGGNPSAHGKSSGSGYGAMMCERSAFFGIKQTIKFLDGTTKSFTPSYSTMQPYAAGNIILNGVSVDKNISNQIMFGCNEMRINIEQFRGNIFATLVGYNFGPGGVYWCICKYVAEKYNYTFVNKRSLSAQSNQVKAKYYEELESGRCNWGSYRQQYKNTWGAGTPTNIELYLQWYKSENGQLPYYIDSSGNKMGYGVGKIKTEVKNNIVTTTNITSNVSTVSQKKSGSEIREIIVDTAKAICQQHTDKLATYDQTYRTVNFRKPRKHPGTFYGLSNPICYDCSSLVSCAYLEAGLESAYSASCYYGTLVANTTKKDGYVMFKITKETIENMLPGDIIMMCNKQCPTTFTRTQAIKVGFTHHTLIYCGKENGTHMVAHARQWAYWPNAIRYMAVYSDIYKYGFCLRPYDLVEADKITNNNNSGGSAGSEGLDTGSKSDIGDSIVEEMNEVTLKGVVGAIPSDYYNDETLIKVVEKNNSYDYLDYPSTVPYIYTHFGINDLTNKGVQEYKDLILALKSSYVNTPIFIASELKVNSSYTEYQTVNDNIDLFNAQMQNFANTEENIIYLDINEGLTSNGMVDSNYSSGGYRFDSKENSQRYYNIVKKHILKKAIGGIYNPSTPETKPQDKSEDEDKPYENVINNVSIVMYHNNTYKYDVVKNITFLLPSAVKENYWSKLKFHTNKNSEPTKVTQSKILYLEGTDCKAGQLIPNADTEYNITVMASTKDDKVTEKYYGVVSGLAKGGSYKDFSDFVGKSDIVKLAKTYYDNKEKFKYNAPTALNYTNPQANISKWKVDGLFNIDGSTFVKLLCMGLSYDKSPYGKTTSKLKKDPNYAWAFTFPRTAAEQAQYCVTQGWVMGGIDVTNWSNVEAGDLLFWDRDGQENGRYMSISHVAMVYGFDEEGDALSIEVTNKTPCIVIKKIKQNTDDKLLFVARIRKE